MYRQRGRVGYGDPYDVGMPGLIGFSSGFHTRMNADTLLLLCPQLPYCAVYPCDAKTLHIDITSGRIGVPSTIAIVPPNHSCPLSPP